MSYAKTITLGAVPGDSYGYKQACPVTVDIELRDGDRGTELSIRGNVWQPGRRDIVSGGQNHDEIAALFPNSPRVQRIVQVWKRWHLNGMRAGCEHQRAMRWADWLIDPAQPKTQMNMWAWVKYGPNVPANRWNSGPWASHVRGLLSKPCPCCGYKYGSAWLHETLPDDIIAEVKGWS